LNFITKTDQFYWFSSKPVSIGFRSGINIVNLAHDPILPTLENQRKLLILRLKTSDDPLEVRSTRPPAH
jgi:hypothetical protein